MGVEVGEEEKSGKKGKKEKTSGVRKKERLDMLSEAHGAWTFFFYVSLLNRSHTHIHHRTIFMQAFSWHLVFSCLFYSKGWGYTIHRMHCWPPILLLEAGQ